MTCPHCHTEMYQANQRWYCFTCPRYAFPGDGPADIERHEHERQAALVLLDVALGDLAVQRETDRQILSEMEATMGQLIQTRGCSKCGGTMYKIIETDQHGTPTGESPYCCHSCGHME
ncbi:hypothetical protein ACH44C_33690 [Streptomyces purpureus]|uniref:hypothetical protein n=1 Tax=Streptomyces purpureus TaxID=1951 RepID=UPI00379B078A